MTKNSHPYNLPYECRKLFQDLYDLRSQYIETHERKIDSDVLVNIEQLIDSADVIACYAYAFRASLDQDG